MFYICQGTVPVSVAELVTDIMAVYASRRASSDALKLAGYAIDRTSQRDSFCRFPIF